MLIKSDSIYYMSLTTDYSTSLMHAESIELLKELQKLHDPYRDYSIVEVNKVETYKIIGPRVEIL